MLSTSLIKGASISALGGLLFGLDTVAVAGSTRALTLQFHLSAAALGFTVSSALCGTVAGALFCGVAGQQLERRQTLRIVAITYLISSLGSFFAWNWPALLLSRFIAGLAIGGSSVAVPVYLAEIAPAAWRGRLVSFFQVNIGVGVLLAYATSYALDLMQVTNSLFWRIQLGWAALPALVFVVFLFRIPPSARWLVSQNRVAEAQAAIEQLGSPELQTEIRGLIAGHEDISKISETLFSRKYRRPILLAVTIAAFNQLSGVNAIIYYLNDLLARGGFSRYISDRNAVLVGILNVVFNLFGTALVDVLGRKTLLLTGSLGMAFSLAGVASSLTGEQHASFLFWCIVAFNLFFSISQGAVMWVYISEIFPTAVRLKGQSLGSSALWILNAMIAGFFPVVAKRSGAYPFSFFAAMMLLQFLVVLLFYPETRGIVLESLDNTLEHGSS